MVSDKTFFKTQLAIVLLGAVGMTLGWYQLFWPGILMFAAAWGTGLVLSHREAPKLSGDERQAAWAKIREKGFTRYSVGYLRLIVFCLTPLIAIDLVCYLFTQRVLVDQKLILSTLFLLVGGMLSLALARWYIEEKRFTKK
jgi:hypothetical protein